MGWNPGLAGKGQRVAAMFAVERLAKQSTDLAAAHWAKIAGYFPPAEQHYCYGRLAYQAARNLDGRALQWYRDASDMPLNEQQSAWRVRAALRAHGLARGAGKRERDEHRTAAGIRVAVLESARAEGAGQNSRGERRFSRR